MLPFEPYGGSLSGPHNFFFASLVDLKRRTDSVAATVYFKKKGLKTIHTRFNLFYTFLARWFIQSPFI
jgi:hypothetical protein